MDNSPKIDVNVPFFTHANTGFNGFCVRLLQVQQVLNEKLLVASS